jgi:hypothetical protein
MSHSISSFNDILRKLPEHAQETMFKAMLAANDEVRGPVIIRAIEMIVSNAKNLNRRESMNIISYNKPQEFFYEYLKATLSLEEYSRRNMRGLLAKQKILEKAGGLLSAEMAAKMIGISRQSINDKRNSGKIIGITFSGGKYKYPAFQFYKGRVLPGLDNVLKALDTDDPWMKTIFMVTKNYLLDGKSPFDMLREGKIDAVVKAAGTFGEQGAR